VLQTVTFHTKLAYNTINKQVAKTQLLLRTAKIIPFKILNNGPTVETIQNQKNTICTALR